MDVDDVAVVQQSVGGEVNITVQNSIYATLPVSTVRALPSRKRVRRLETIELDL